MGATCTKNNIIIGARVVPNTNLDSTWSWGNQGNGQPGTIRDHRSEVVNEEELPIEIDWDDDLRESYRRSDLMYLEDEITSEDILFQLEQLEEKLTKEQ